MHAAVIWGNMQWIDRAMQFHIKQWQNYILRVVSLGYCTVYHAFTRFWEKNTLLGQFGSCCRVSLPFHNIIGKYWLHKLIIMIKAITLIHLIFSTYVAVCQLTLDWKKALHYMWHHPSCIRNSIIARRDVFKGGTAQQANPNSFFIGHQNIIWWQWK